MLVLSARQEVDHAQIVISYLPKLGEF